MVKLCRNLNTYFTLHTKKVAYVLLDTRISEIIDDSSKISIDFLQSAKCYWSLQRVYTARKFLLMLYRALRGTWSMWTKVILLQGVHKTFNWYLYAPPACRISNASNQSKPAHLIPANNGNETVPTNLWFEWVELRLQLGWLLQRREKYISAFIVLICIHHSCFDIGAVRTRFLVLCLVIQKKRFTNNSIGYYLAT